MRIAVTGAAGRFGRHLVPHLTAAGHAVRAIDVAVSPEPVRGAQDVVCDLGDSAALLRALEGCTALVHLAAVTTMRGLPPPQLHRANVVGSFNVLWACAELGIERVCLASSINAIGGVHSRAPRYDYIPLDEAHPSYVEDAYGLSKWILEQQAEAMARRYEWMRIASLRFHGLVDERSDMNRVHTPEQNAKHLWGYTLKSAAARACALALSANFVGHAVFFIVAPETISDLPTRELIEAHYPAVPVRRELPGHCGLYDCHKAEHMLGWRHDQN